MTRDELMVIRNAIRALDCGHHYCRFCKAGTHNGWLHETDCAYVESVKVRDAAKRIVDDALSRVT